jgi:hypothetical protein
MANRLAIVNTSDSAIAKITVSLYEDGGRVAAQRDISLDAFCRLFRRPSLISCRTLRRSTATLLSRPRTRR